MVVPIVVDPLLSSSGAEEVVRLWHDFGEYKQYKNKGFATQFAPELHQRYDARDNFVRSGGRFGRQDSKKLLRARTNYFRETYAYGADVYVEGFKFLIHSEALLDASRRLYGRPVIVPSILYSNILVPGQELAVHTDVPEFRGGNRKVLPPWLLVAMHHAGLFEKWRMPIATAVTYFGHANGGALVYYPEGPEGVAATYEAKHNTAVVLDTDSIFHGVDRVNGDESPLNELRSVQRLRHDGAGQWSLVDGDRVIAKYVTDDLRFSVSWKAYCFADDAERDAWTEHTDDLTLKRILDTLEADLGVERPASDVDFGRLLIERYIPFPEVSPIATDAERL